jgi:hypothetical protein
MEHKKNLAMTEEIIPKKDHEVVSEYALNKDLIHLVSKVFGSDS